MVWKLAPARSFLFQCVRVLHLQLCSTIDKLCMTWAVHYQPQETSDLPHCVTGWSVNLVHWTHFPCSSQDKAAKQLIEFRSEREAICLQSRKEHLPVFFHVHDLWLLLTWNEAQSKPEPSFLPPFKLIRPRWCHAEYSAGSFLLRTPGDKFTSSQALSHFHFPYSYKKAFPSLGHIVSGAFARIWDIYGHAHKSSAPNWSLMLLQCALYHHLKQVDMLPCQAGTIHE